MALSGTIQTVLNELRSERNKLDQVIQALESSHEMSTNGRRGAPSSSRRRRRPMSAAARKAVGQRMKRYWAKRRAEKAKGAKKNGRAAKAA